MRYIANLSCSVQQPSWLSSMMHIYTLMADKTAVTARTVLKLSTLLLNEKLYFSLTTNSNAL